MTEIVNPADFVRTATYRLDGPRDLIDPRKKSIFSWRKDESPVIGVLYTAYNAKTNNDYWGELTFNVNGDHVPIYATKDGKFYGMEYNKNATILQGQYKVRMIFVPGMTKSVIDEKTRVHIYNHAAPEGLNGGTRRKRHTKRKSQKRRKRRTHRRR